MSKLLYYKQFQKSPNHNPFFSKQALLFILEYNRVMFISYVFSLSLPNDSLLNQFNNTLVNNQPFEHFIDEIIEKEYSTLKQVLSYCIKNS